MVHPSIVLSIILCCLIQQNVIGFQFGFQSNAFRARLTKVSHAQNRKEVIASLQLTADPNVLDNDIHKHIDQLVKTHKVVLFMKGNKLFPQCGFSNTASRILQSLDTPFETVDVLEDNRIRNGIKVYSNWPTIPQLYIGGEFIGGSDIMTELYKNGGRDLLVFLCNAFKFVYVIGINQFSG